MNIQKEYARKIQESFDLGQPLVGPFSASVPVTTRCNSSCGYCPPPRVRQLSDLDMGIVKETLHQLRDIGVRQISVTGGEPLLRDDLEEIIVFATDLKFMTIVLTNGKLLTKKRLESLLNAGATGFVISLDTLDNETYRKIRGTGIEQTLHAIENLAQLKKEKDGIITSVTSVLTKYNIGHLVELARYLDKRWIDLQIQPCLDASDYEITNGSVNIIQRLRESLREIQNIYGQYITKFDREYLDYVPVFLQNHELPENFRCLAAYHLVHLDAELNLYPCWSSSPVGNILQSPLSKLWYGDAMRKIRLEFSKGHCPHCWLLCDAKPSLRYMMEDLGL